MTHLLVSQLHFTRNEFMRAVKGISDDDARRRILPMNCISWNIGQLAWQDQRYFLIYHYWYHIGENMAIRQQLGHSRLPQFVGAIDSKAPYQPEND